MNLNGFLILSITSAIFAFVLFLICLLNFKKMSSILGIIVSLIFLGIAGYSLQEINTSTQTMPSDNQSSKINSNSIAAFPGSALAVFRRRDAQNSILNLSHENIDLNQSVEKFSAQKSWMILDASEGILPEYNDWISEHIGVLNPIAVPDSNLPSLQNICWQRNLFFPYASVKCTPHKINQTFQSASLVFARTQSGSPVIAGASIQNTIVAMSLVPLAATSRAEIQCLVALSSGNICVLREDLPNATIKTLQIDPQTPIQKAILSENNILVRQNLSDADLELVPPKPNIAVNKIENSKQDNNICSGIFDSKSVTGIYDSGSSQELKEIRTAASYDSFVQRMVHNNPCSHAMILPLPEYDWNNEIIAMRSLFSAIRAQPVWLTGLESLENRVRSLESVHLVADENSGQMTLHNPNNIKNISLSFISPTFTSDATLSKIKLEKNAQKWSLFRSGPNASRIVFNFPIKKLSLDFAALVDEKNDKQSTPFDIYSIQKLILCSFSIAVFLSLIQTASTIHNRQYFYPNSFVASFSIIFCLLWQSYKQMSFAQGAHLSAIHEEGHDSISHVFLRDWPLEWYPKWITEEKKNPILTESLWSKWNALLKKAKLVPATDAVGLKAFDIDNLEPASIAGSGKVLIWNSQRIQSWYSQHKLESEKILVGWHSVMKASGPAFDEITDSNLTEKLTSEIKILVIPDIRFVLPSEIVFLEKWMSQGGKIIYNEKRNEESPAAQPVDDSKWPKLWKNTLTESGYSKTTSSIHSLTQSMELGNTNINISHRILSHLASKQIPWLGAAAYGHGGAYYAGIDPLDENSQKLLTQLISSLRGTGKLIPKNIQKCQSALFVTPFGATKESLTQVMNRARKRGIHLNWLVDSASFPLMIPEMNQSFQSQGVVFLDDGNSQHRNAANYLWKIFKNDDTSIPVFAHLSHAEKQITLKNISHSGDTGFLLRAVQLPKIESVAPFIEKWKSDCAYGVADPRIIPASDLTENSEKWIQLLTQLQDIQISEAYFLARRFQELNSLIKSANEQAKPQNLKLVSSPWDPLISKKEFR